MKYRFSKVILTKLGRAVPKRFFHHLNGVFNYLHIGWWFKDRRLSIPFYGADRAELYRQVASEAHEPLDYLEFGVFKGASMRIWSGLLKHGDTRLYGFDSFEGLPEKWRSAADIDTFNVHGAIPQIDDARITFVKGWFESTLPQFLGSHRPERNLIVHFDADLYSSTRLIMVNLKPFFKPGTIFVFDELFDRDHELKALDELIAEENLSLECIGATKGLTQAAFRVV